MAQPTDTGMNRTGLATAREYGQQMLDIVQDESPQPAERLGLAQVRKSYSENGELLGSVPPPATVKGWVTTTLETLKGNKPTVLLDKLSERLAFERTGVRLYDALLTKFDSEAGGGWEGGPTRDMLGQFRDDELSHFHMIQECIERLGADPTAMTPSADLVGMEGSGILKVITDSRTTLEEALHAQLIAERADVDGWSLLIELAEGAGHSSMADGFRTAHQREEEHAATVKAWMAKAACSDLEREIGDGGKKRSLPVPDTTLG